MFQHQHQQLPEILSAGGLATLSAEQAYEALCKLDSLAVPLRNAMKTSSSLGYRLIASTNMIRCKINNTLSLLDKKKRTKMEESQIKSLLLEAGEFLADCIRIHRSLIAESIENENLDFAELQLILIGAWIEQDFDFFEHIAKKVFANKTFVSLRRSEITRFTKQLIELASLARNDSVDKGAIISSFEATVNQMINREKAKSFGYTIFSLPN